MSPAGAAATRTRGSPAAKGPSTSTGHSGIELHEGWIRIENSPTVGACVSFWRPVEVSTALRGAVAAIEASPRPRHFLVGWTDRREPASFSCASVRDRNIKPVEIGDSAMNPSFVSTEIGTYIFELKVYDGKDTSIADTVTISVQEGTVNIMPVSPTNGAVVTKTPIFS